MIARRNFVVVLCSVMVLGLASAALAADEATGTWKWEVTRQDNKVEMTLKLKQDGEKLTGTLARMGGDGVEIKDGKVKDGTLSFSVTQKRGDVEFTSKYSGKVEGDAIKGKIETERDGQTRSRDWEAKKAKE